MKKNVPPTTWLTTKKCLEFVFRESFIYAILSVLFLFATTNSSAQTVVVNPGSPWVVPAGVTSIKVEVWGGGGGGGFALFGNGGGGGGGAYNVATFAVSAGQSYTSIVGQGGASDADGNSSSFSGPGGTVSAAGGGAGVLNVFGSGGNGGTGATGTRNGGNGADEAAGGGGAGNNGNGGSTTSNTAGTGGAGTPNAAPYRGGNGGTRGNNGSTPGGGAGGGSGIGDGGTGGNGQVVITYTTGPIAPSVAGFTSPACIGQTISIQGLNFTTGATVTFAPGITVPATFTNAQNISAVLPAGATGNFTVTTPGGTSATAGSINIQNTTTPLSVSGAGTFCGSTSIAASGGSGGNIYFQGTNAAGTSQALGSPQTISTAGTNTYYFRELTACGWGTAYGVTVTINPLPSNFTVNVAATCNSALLTPSGAAGDVFYFQGTTPGGSSTADPGPQTVLAAGTYYYRARTAAGCWGSDVAVNVVFTVTASITDQPVSKIICVGANTNFTINATSGTTLSYQWRKGVTNLTNGAGISGVNTNTLVITNANAGHAATDYNCVVTDACGSLVSDYVTLTVNTVAVAPSVSATALIFPTVGVTSVLGSFTPSASATDYLVVRSNSSTALTPVNGTSYLPGDALGAGVVVSVGPDNFFTASGLNPGQAYYFHVFAFNINNCGGTPSPLYRTPALINSVTTATSTNCPGRVTLYWAGTGAPTNYDAPASQRSSNFNSTRNWSTSNTSYQHANAFPTRCNDVVIYISTGDVTITMNQDNEFYNLTFTVTGNGNAALLSSNQNDVTVYGNAVIDVVGGNSSTTIGIGEANTTSASRFDFKANVNIGATTGVNGVSTFRGNQNSRIIVRGDLTLGRSFSLATGTNTVINNTLPRTLEMDGTGLQQITWNNNNSAYPARFRDVVIGNTNNPTVRQVTGALTVPQNIIGNLTINGSSTLDLRTTQWNQHNNNGTFTMNGSSKLLLAGTSSQAAGGTLTPVTGSNFPSGFTTNTFNGTSSVEYNGSNLVSQTINPAVNYKNLILTRSTSSGTANKLTSGAVTVANSITINDGVLLTMSHTLTCNGSFNILSSGALTSGTNIVNGTGTFNLDAGATLSTANVNGITSSGNSGTIQSSGARTFNSGANYVYNGVAAQNTGNGLPTTLNNLTINNLAGVTLNTTSASHTISGILYQTSGTLNMNNKLITVNNITRSSGTFTGSHSSGVTVNGTNIPLFFSTVSTANSTLKTLVLNNGKSAYLGTALNITAGLTANNSGTVTLGTSATLTTGDNLTFQSNEFGTASLATMPAGASISGKATIERYLKNYKAWRFVATPVKTATSPTITESWRENNNNASTGYGTRITGPSGTGLDENTSGYSMKWYNSTTNNYVAINNMSLPVANKEGYMLYVRGDRSVGAAGTPTATNLRIKGEVNVGNMSYSVGATKFLSVGNPYPAAISAEALLSATPGLQAAYYAWDPSILGSYNAGGYQTLSSLDGFTPTVGGSALYQAAGTYADIQSGQAFYIYNPTGATVNFNITEAMKSAGSSTAVSRENTPADRQFMRAKLFSNDSTIADGNMVAFDEELSNAIDGDDALKFTNSGENFGIARAGKKLSVEARHRIAISDTIFYNMSNLKQQAYKLVLAPDNFNDPTLSAFLVDKFLNTQTPVSLTASNTIWFNVTSAAASKAADRFMMVFTKTGVVLPVTIVSVSANKNSDRSIAVQWKVENELNMQQYEVERSKDGAAFNGIITTSPTAVNGGSAEYKVTDFSPLSGDNFYRIKAISIGGQVQYSTIVKVAADVNIAPSINVYPNPVENKQMNVSFIKQSKGNYALEVINMNGQVLYKSNVKLNGNNYNETIYLPQNMAAGRYELRVVAADGTSNSQAVFIR